MPASSRLDLTDIRAHVHLLAARFKRQLRCTFELSPSAVVGHAGRQSVPGWAASIRYGFLAAQDNSILLPGPLLLPSHSAVGGRP